MQSGKGRTWRKRRKKNGQPGCFLGATRPQSLSHDGQYIDLIRWMLSHGLHVGNLCPAHFNDTGRGLMTLAPLRPRDVVVSVPRVLLITCQTAIDSCIGQIVRKNKFTHVSPLLLLCLYLVYEKKKGEGSFWYHYIKSLPSSYSTPAFFSEDELSCLPQCLQGHALEQLEHIKLMYNLAIPVGKIVEQDLTLKGGLSWQSFLWSWGVVNTRSVYMKYELRGWLTVESCHYALAPYLDLLNHSAEAEVDAVFDGDTECYTIRTMNTYKKYDQVFINYGPHDNCRLFLEYGFILPHNLHNIVEIEIDDLDQLAAHTLVKDWKQVKSLIKRFKLNRSLFVSDDGASWNLQCCLRVILYEFGDRVSFGDFFRIPSTSEGREKIEHLLHVLLQEKLSTFQKCFEGLGGDNIHHQLIRRLMEQLIYILHQNMSLHPS